MPKLPSRKNPSLIKEKYKKPKINIIDKKNPLITLLQEHYAQRCENGIHFIMDTFPVTVNQMYEGTGRNKSLTVSQIAFREYFHLFFRKHKITFRPDGHYAIVAQFISPKWINKKDGYANQKDSDNFLKPLMDAIQEASNVPDELAFEHHLFKVHGKEEKLVFTLYDIEAAIYTYS